MVGLWCPFCRRQLVQLGALEGKLKALGVESLAVVAHGLPDQRDAIQHDTNAAGRLGGAEECQRLFMRRERVLVAPHTAQCRAEVVLDDCGVERALGQR
jgi:hypothetical protein